MATKSWQYVHQ